VAAVDKARAIPEVCACRRYRGVDVPLRYRWISLPVSDVETPRNAPVATTIEMLPRANGILASLTTILPSLAGLPTGSLDALA